MGCRLSSENQVIRRKSSHAITGNDLINSTNALPRNFVPEEASNILHDAIEKRNEDSVIRLLCMYKEDDYKILLNIFVEEYSIDPVTLAFQNLSSNTSEFVRLRLTSQIKNICHFINFHLRDKSPNFQGHVLGILLGYQEISLRELTREYFNSYGYLLSTHICNGFEGEILDFLRDLLNRNTDEEVFDENTRLEYDMSQSSLTSPSFQKIMRRKSQAFIFPNGSLKTKITNHDLIYDGKDILNLAIKDCITLIYEANRSNNLTDGDFVIFKFIANFSRQKLRDIFNGYLQKYQKDVVIDIEKSAPKSYLRDLLVLSVQILRNDSNHFANEINSLLKSTDEDSAKNYYLMFYLMTRGEEQMNQIKKSYRSRYFQSLSDDIRSLISDSFLQNILIKALARVSSTS